MLKDRQSQIEGLISEMNKDLQQKSRAIQELTKQKKASDDMLRRLGTQFFLFFQFFPWKLTKQKKASNEMLGVFYACTRRQVQILTHLAGFREQAGRGGREPGGTRGGVVVEAHYCGEESAR